IIVGAGPAGISTAVEAINAGISSEKILIIEKAEAHSFTIRKFYPQSKPVTANYKGMEANALA
ncbi:MAG: NAD(P)-binding domain-containing protein, partial [Ignavibacteria bacterium]